MDMRTTYSPVDLKEISNFFFFLRNKFKRSKIVHFRIIIRNSELRIEFFIRIQFFIGNPELNFSSEIQNWVFVAVLPLFSGGIFGVGGPVREGPQFVRQAGLVHGCGISVTFAEN